VNTVLRRSTRSLVLRGGRSGEPVHRRTAYRYFPPKSRSCGAKKRSPARLPSVIRESTKSRYALRPWSQARIWCRFRDDEPSRGRKDRSDIPFLARHKRGHCTAAVNANASRIASTHSYRRSSQQIPSSTGTPKMTPGRSEDFRGV